MTIIKKHFSPDPGASSGNPPKKVKKIRSIPYGDSDFLTTAQTANATWKANPFITLVYITQPEFEALVAEYETSLTGRQQSGSERPSETASLKQVNKLINEGVTEVKNYIEKKFKTKNAKPQFPRYGIVHKNKGWKMSSDKDERKKALELMVKAINDDGFGAEDYGTTFWTDIQKKFNDAVKAATDTDKAVTGGVSMKSSTRKTIQKVM